MLLAGRDQLERGHAIHRVVVIHPVHPALVALMHAVDPDIPWHPIQLGRSALADGDAGGPRLGPVPSRALGWGPAPKIVEMGHRNARQSLEARIPEQPAGPFP